MPFIRDDLLVSAGGAGGSGGGAGAAAAVALADLRPTGLNVAKWASRHIDPKNTALTCSDSCARAFSFLKNMAICGEFWFWLDWLRLSCDCDFWCVCVVVQPAVAGCRRHRESSFRRFRFQESSRGLNSTI